MNTAFAHHMATVLRLALLALAVPALLACSDSASEDSGSVNFTTGALQRQLGFREDPETSALVGPADNESTTLARAVVVGAVVIRSRSLAQGPYSDQTPITDIGLLEDDIRDSANLVQLFSLPVADSEVRIRIPPPGAAKWQIMAAAFSTQPLHLDELALPVHQNAVIYLGFTTDPAGQPVFLKTSNDGEIFVLDGAGNPTGGPVTNLSLVLKRACLISLPKGCAQFVPGLNVTPLLNTGVEIYEIELDGMTPAPLLIPGYPIIVRAAPDVASEDTIGVVTATIIGAAFDPVSAGGLDTSVEVFTTHILAPNQDPACALLDNNAPTVAQLDPLLGSSCSGESYFTPGQ